jgi:glycosyltransferase involved in cell wall biosynthesis
MRVLVDALSGKGGGSLTYLAEQMRALAQVRPDLDLCLLVAPWNEEAFGQLGVPMRKLSVPNLPVRVAYQQFMMPFVARHWDLLYCPGNICPLFNVRAPVVVTMQSAHYFGYGLRLPENQYARLRFEATMARLSVRRADAVVVVSNSLMSELVSDGLQTARCRVIQSGVPAWPTASYPPPGPVLPGRFYTSLARDYPHKRLTDLIRAWVGFSSRTPTAPALVIAGEISPRRLLHLRTLVPSALNDRLVHLGLLNDRASVRWLLEHADAMITTSELESFGLTVVEAGSLGCPVVATDIPPHREVGGNHPLYFRVGDIGGLAEALGSVFASNPPRAAWSGSGTWEENAARLADTFDEVVAA